MSKFTDSIYGPEFTGHWSIGHADCAECLDDSGEPHKIDFSSMPCASCGSTYGGERHAACLFLQTGETKADGRSVHCHPANEWICVDCLLYHANGDEPEEPWFRTPWEAREAQWAVKQRHD